MSRDRDTGLRIRIPGHIKGTLVVEGFGPSRCGDVSDGIPVRHEEDSAGFALSLADLEAVVAATKKARAERSGK